jgi:hypothetical protein
VGNSRVHQPVLGLATADGYAFDVATRHILPIAPQVALGSMANLRDRSAIREQLDRIQRAVPDDPALAVGSAKELIEITAKVLMLERDLTIRVHRPCRRSFVKNPGGVRRRSPTYVGRN